MGGGEVQFILSKIVVSLAYGGWVELSTCEDAFLLAPEILFLLRDFLYMGDLFNCSKRKTRTSDSDSEIKSPEGKSVCNELTAVDFRDDAITDNDQEAQAFIWGNFALNKRLANDNL